MSETAQAAPPTGRVERPSAKPEASGAKVTVYCKLPSGVRLRTFEMVPARESMPGGGHRDFHIAVPNEVEILINGNARRPGEPQRHDIVFGFGVTRGVPKDLWDQWRKDNAKTPMVVNGLIFAAERRELGDDEAKDRQDILSGLEPINPPTEAAPNSDPRLPRPTMKGLTGIVAGNREAA